MSWRQMQGAAHLFHACGPTTRRQATTRRGGTTGCRELQLRGAYFHAGLAVDFADEQVGVATACALKVKWSLCLQSPIAAHSAANGVDCGPARVIEVQPNLAIERQAILIGGAQAATPFADAQATVRRHPKGGVPLPITGHIGLRRINAFSAFGCGHTQTIGAGKTPDFFASPETIDRRSRQNLRDTAAARGQRQGKMSGPHLHAHGTIGVDTHRQLAAECHRREPGGQWAGELHFAPLARDVQAELRCESHRNVIFDQSIDLYFERVGGGSGGSRTQRNCAIRTRGLPDQSTIDGECDQRRLWRHRQLRRPLRPTETST